MNVECDVVTVLFSLAAFAVGWFGHMAFDVMLWKIFKIEAEGLDNE